MTITHLLVLNRFLTNLVFPTHYMVSLSLRPKNNVQGIPSTKLSKIVKMHLFKQRRRRNMYLLHILRENPRDLVCRLHTYLHSMTLNLFYIIFFAFCIALTYSLVPNKLSALNIISFVCLFVPSQPPSGMILISRLKIFPLGGQEANAISRF